jgi:hypothetical protein
MSAFLEHGRRGTWPCQPVLLKSLATPLPDMQSEDPPVLKGKSEKAFWKNQISSISRV